MNTTAATEAQINYARKLQASYDKADFMERATVTISCNLSPAAIAATLPGWTEADAADRAEALEALGVEKPRIRADIRAWEAANGRTLGGRAKAIRHAAAVERAQAALDALMVDPATLTKDECSRLIDALRNIYTANNVR